MSYGTLMSWDALKYETTPVPQFGFERAWENLAARINLQNAVLRETLGLFVDYTTEAEVAAWGQVVGTMELAEMGEGPFIPPPQKVGVDIGNIGYPLRRFGLAIQWDADYLENAAVGELAQQTEAALLAARTRTQIELRRAIFNPTNYSFRDIHVTKRLLAVKAFANADGQPLPLGPNGEIFNENTHTHYLATAALSAGDVGAVIKTVQEHATEGQLMLYINENQVPAIEAMTGNFRPYPEEGITGQTGVFAVGGTQNRRNVYNRNIGVFNGVAIVAVRTWMPAGYMFCYNTGTRKPLVMRERRPGSGVMRLIAEYRDHPLQANKWLLEFAFAVQERVNGAILYVGGSSYVAPVIIA